MFFREPNLLCNWTLCCHWNPRPYVSLPPTLFSPHGRECCSFYVDLNFLTHSSRLHDYATLVLQTTSKPNNLLEKPALSASNKMPQLGKKLQVLRLGSQFSYWLTCKCNLWLLIVKTFRFFFFTFSVITMRLLGNLNFYTKREKGDSNLSFPYKENWMILLNHQIIGIGFIFIVNCLGPLLILFFKRKENNWILLAGYKFPWMILTLTKNE